MSDLNNDYHNYMSQMLGGQVNAQNQQLYDLGMQNSAGQNSYNPPRPVAQTAKKGQSMFKEITTDVRAFILEHRGVIYFLAFALIVDHFVFRGAFKARLQGCVDKLVTKVEEKIQ